MVTVKQSDFEEKLAKGRSVERCILLFLCSIGYIVEPLSNIEDIKGKGPRLYFPNPHPKWKHLPILIPSPDLQCTYGFDGNAPFDLPFELLVDAKSKKKCSWYRINYAYQSGIDRSCWKHYLQVEKRMHKPVWVFHLIEPTSDDDLDKQGAPKDKRPSPTGLYIHPVGMPIAYSHDSNQSMVFWKVKDMQNIASLEEVEAVSNGKVSRDVTTNISLEENMEVARRSLYAPKGIVRLSEIDV